MSALRTPFERAARGAAAGAEWSLPYPGNGDTASRHRALFEIARHDLALARIAEAHTDALAILHEAGRAPRPQALYGVWAAESPDTPLRAHFVNGVWRLDGVKRYCSGASFADAALITAHCGDERRLFDIALNDAGIRIMADDWATPVLAETATRSVLFDDVSIDADQAIGAPGWYLQRPGFWHGALGPAACWAGGAMSLIDIACQSNRREPHARAQLGALHAAGWALQAFIERAGIQIDGDPLDRSATAQSRALMVRHLIERTCTDVLDRFGRALGAPALSFNAHAARQHAALTLYIRQCHGERDLQALADSMPAAATL